MYHTVLNPPYTKLRAPPLTIHVTDMHTHSQAEKVAKVSAKAAPSVTARFFVTTSRVSPSPLSVVLRDVAVSSVFLPVCWIDFVPQEEQTR